MDKFWQSVDMIREEGVGQVELIQVTPIAEDVLCRVHTPEYLQKIKTGSLTPAETVKLGLPPSQALLDRCRLEVAGTVAATWNAMTDGMACNLGGGTHHAFADRGLGYCVLNDVAVAIRDVAVTRPGLRSFVLDTDAHQGNGTNGLFAGDRRVFTYSIHVGKNYPSEKTPGSLDVELERYASSEHYLERLEATLAPALDDFRPELVYWIAGADPHENDRFGQLRLTDAAMRMRDEQVIRSVLSREIPLVVLYGGGYNRNRIHTARLHANTVLLAAALRAQRN
jgi:acetoin utilization deacetylase AcuC-like enzyme